jgi:hypothetical protein
MSTVKKLIVSYLLAIQFLYLPGFSFAQKDSLDLKLKWYAGTLLLDDSTSLRGFVQNNEKFRLIKFRQRLDAGEEMSFQEKRILSMQFFDSTLSKDRNFFTLEIEDESSLYQGPVLFEVVMVMKDFVVLSRKFGVLPDEKPKKIEPSKIEYDQVEKVFLAGEDSKAQLLLLMVLPDNNKTRKAVVPIEPFFDWDVLKKFTGTKWNDVKAYIKKNSLNVYRKSDLLNALEYYQRLEE